MAMPCLEVDLNKIHHNAQELVKRLNKRGIFVTGVTKATLGSVDVANILLRAGINSLGDSRIENLKAMRLEQDSALLKNVSMMLIRSPMLSQLSDVVEYADVSCNTEVEVIKALSVEAKRQGRTHEVLLMIELGDLREGIMPKDLIELVRQIIDLPNIRLKGIGTNLACRSGVSPDSTNMSSLSELARSVETTFNLKLETVSGGNSANLKWALSDETLDTERINNLRVGEAILLGCETLQRQPIAGLYTDAITLTAEVIESKIKPSKPIGDIAQDAFGDVQLIEDRGDVRQAILAIGRQDIDIDGLQAPNGVEILSGSSDHLVVESSKEILSVGQHLTFQINYSALLRAMTSPFVTKHYIDYK